MRSERNFPKGTFSKRGPGNPDAPRQYRPHMEQFKTDSNKPR